MDREQKIAYEIVRQRIVDRLDKLEAAIKAGTKLPSGDAYSLKKWRRFGAAFAWDPSVYTVILENPVMSDQALISELRKLEQTFMRKWGVIDKIPLHHKIASRTGGDLGIRTPVDVWLETKKRIFDATGAAPGNGKANLNAAGQFDELAHLGREGAKGSVFAEAGISRPEDFPYLHRAGQNLAVKAGDDPKLVMGTAAEQAEALKPSIIQQLERFEETTATPQVQNQRQILTRAGYPEAFAPETSIERIQQINKEIQGTDIPKQFAEAFDFTGGNARLNFQAPDVSESWQIIESRQQFPNRLIGARKTAAGLAGAGILALGPLGTAASAAETAERTKIAQQTGSILDKTQAGISGVSLAADVASYNPLAAIPGTLISTGADVINLVIDGGRAMVSGEATYNRKQLERQERLRRLPADHPERQGFAAGGGM